MGHDRMPPEFVRTSIVLRRQQADWLEGWAKGIGANRSVVCRAIVEHFRSLPETMRRMIVATHAGGSDEEAGTEPPPDRS